MSRKKIKSNKCDKYVRKQLYNNVVLLIRAKRQLMNVDQKVLSVLQIF